MSAPVITIYDPKGAKLAQVEGTAPREWILGQTSSAQIKLPRTDDKITEQNIKPGNRIRVESAGVIDWTGLIWTPIEWSEDTITLNCYGAEYYFERRIIQDISNEEESIRELLAALMEEANRNGSVPITLNSNISVTYDETEPGILAPGMTIRDGLDTLAAASFAEWWIDPVFNDVNGVLRWELFFQKDRRTYGPPLIDGGACNVTREAGVVNGGDIVTAIYFNVTLPSANPSIYIFNEAAKAKYGLWERAVNISAIGVQHALITALNWIKREALPRLRIELDVFPEGNATITRTLRPGSQHDCWFAGYHFYNGMKGFRGKVRVIGMSYDERDGVIRTIVEEVIDPGLDQWYQPTA